VLSPNAHPAIMMVLSLAIADQCCLCFNLLFRWVVRAYTVAPTSVAANYLTQIWSGATVVCIVWFLYRWKTNVFARIVTGKSFAGPDKERYLTMDHLSSLGLLILGCMAVAEACGMAVQSILTVGGIGGEYLLSS